MDLQEGLGNGTRVAIVGGGITGAATAAALLFAARARGKHVDVRVFEGDRDPSAHRAPVVLSPECRSRLSALGCRVPPEWRAVELSGVEVISGRSRSLLSGPPGGLWVVDAWPEGYAGRTMIARALASVAGLHGAKFIPRRVDRIEAGGRTFKELAPMSGPGGLVVWANGANERAHAAILASGAAAPIASRFFDGFSGAPTLPAAEARLQYDPFSGPHWTVAKLLLSPMPGMDALYLVPCRASIYAIGFGALVEPADLCQALMMAARDGHLPEGFEISHLGATRVASGVGSNLCGNGQVAVGPAALGHGLQLTLSEALASCSRAAIALVDAGGDGKAMKRRYVRDGIFDLADDAKCAVKSLSWLVRAKGAAAHAMARAQAKGGQLVTSGVLGLPQPSPLALLSHARLAAFRESLSALWRSAVEPMAPSHPEFEPSLFYVVDDDPVVRSGVAELLESRGAEVVSFSSELALFSAVARRPPQAILLDVVLSWVDGLRLCEELKRHPLTREVPVVMMSGLNRSYVRERAEAAGALAFLPKPIAPDRLFRALQGKLEEPNPRPSSPPLRFPANPFTDAGAHVG